MLKNIYFACYPEESGKLLVDKDSRYTVDLFKHRISCGEFIKLFARGLIILAEADIHWRKDEKVILARRWEQWDKVLQEVGA